MANSVLIVIEIHFFNLPITTVVGSNYSLFVKYHHVTIGNIKWLAPGGHCDGNPNVFASAVREAREETGLTNLIPLLNGKIFDVNVGAVQDHTHGDIFIPTHLHFDICFAFEAPENAPLLISEESTQLAWVPLDKIPSLNFPPSHYRRPKKTELEL